MHKPEGIKAPDRRPLPPLAQLPSVITLLAGAWLIVAPFLLDYRGAATWVDGYWNDILVGTAIIAASATRILTPPFTAR